MTRYMKSCVAVALAGAVSLFSAVGSSAATPDQAGDLAATVRGEINKSDALLGDNLSIETVGGVVYVHGIVDTEVERADAHAAAVKAAGGAEVVDMTEIAY